MDVYDEKQGSVLGVKEVDRSQVNKYGIVDGEFQSQGLYKVNDLVEKPDTSTAPSNIAILGRYIISPRIFEILEHTVPGKNGEIQLTDALKTLLREEEMYAYVFEGKRYDIGDKVGFIEATIDFALKRPELREGVLNILKDRL